MTKHFSLAAEAIVPLPEPALHIADIVKHLEGHGARASAQGGATVLDFEFSRGVLEPVAGALKLRAEAGDRSLLQEVKMELAEHVEEFTGAAIESIVWRGDATSADSPPNFRLMRVVDTRRITSHMQRVRLAGDDLLRFSGLANLHCKLLIPPQGVEPSWPYLDARGSFCWPQGPGKPAVRKYTIRAIDVEAGWLDIDLVLHEDGGPGSQWAENAKVGDVIGVVGPGGRGVATADWVLLAGDETALPAIARALETLPASTRGVALIETDGPDQYQQLDGPPGLAIHWLFRGGAAAGTTTLLIDAVRATPRPEATDGSVFVWAGCEFAAFKEIRSYVRKELGIAPEHHLVTSYWRRGLTEDGAGRLESATRAVARVGRAIGL